MVPPEGVSATADVTTPPTLDTRPTAHAVPSTAVKLRPTRCAAATGRTMRALMSSSPTVRIESTTVTAVRTASVEVRARVGSPTARACSSSSATARSQGRRTRTTTSSSAASTANTATSAVPVVVIAPKR